MKLIPDRTGLACKALVLGATSAIWLYDLITDPSKFSVPDEAS